MGNEEKLFDTFGEYLDKCGDVEFDFFCDDLYCDHTVVWNSYNDKLTEKAKEKWNKLLGSKYEVTYSDDKYRIRQINIPDENLRKSALILRMHRQDIFRHQSTTSCFVAKTAFA